MAPPFFHLEDYVNEDRLMGLDVGRKTIGVAVSDLLGITAQGVEVWRRRSMKEDVDHLLQLCRERDVSLVVVGHPIRTDGNRGPEAEYVEAFAQELEAAGLCTVLWDERFTTAGAERTLIDAGVSRKKRKAVVDMTAAVLILQTFMERRRSRDDRTGHNPR